jgi:hypothetical protein
VTWKLLAEARALLLDDNVLKVVVVHGLNASLSNVVSRGVIIFVVHPVCHIEVAVCHVKLLRFLVHHGVEHLQTLVNFLH